MRYLLLVLFAGRGGPCPVYAGLGVPCHWQEGDEAGWGRGWGQGDPREGSAVLQVSEESCLSCGTSGGMVQRCVHVCVRMCAHLTNMWWCFVQREHLEIVTKAGDVRSQGRVCGSLGSIHCLQGEYQVAVEYYAQVRPVSCPCSSAPSLVLTALCVARPRRDCRLTSSSEMLTL